MKGSSCHQGVLVEIVVNGRVDPLLADMVAGALALGAAVVAVALDPLSRTRGQSPCGSPP